MKIIQFLLLTAGLFLASNNTVKGQSILIQKQDGSIHTELISNVRNVHFSSDDLVLQFTNGSTNGFALSELKKVYFDTTIGVAEQSTDKLTLSPNPATNTIYIQGITSFNETLSVYRADGALVFSQDVSSSNLSLDLSEFSPGLYIVHIAGVTSKFIKK